MRAISAYVPSAFAAGHGNKQAGVAVDDFHVPDDKTVVENHGDEGFQFVIRFSRDWDRLVGDIHRLLPLSSVGYANDRH